MAKETFETMKKILLAGFVLSGVVLIMILWIQGFSGVETSGSGLSGQTGTGAQSSFSATQTAIINNWETEQAPSQSPALSQTSTPSPTLSQPTSVPPAVTQSITPDLTQVWNIDQGNS